MPPRQSSSITWSIVAIFSIQIGKRTLSIPPRAVVTYRTVVGPHIIIAIFRAELVTVGLPHAITYQNILLLKFFANCSLFGHDIM